VGTAENDRPYGRAGVVDLDVQHTGNLAGHRRTTGRAFADQLHIVQDRLGVLAAAGEAAGAAARLGEQPGNLLDARIDFDL
jgi:hypothetical protein